ncbi:hypothetical protein SAMN04487934_104106 [Eubacterium ruminantium]|nr:hypothetical protein SAMN04487934_104106 [Eubacterium ruminantium]
MPLQKFVETNDQDQFTNYIMSQKQLQDMLMPFGQKEGRSKPLDGIPYRSFRNRIFEEGRWPRTLQNDYLLMLLYSIAGDDKYIDNTIGGLLNSLDQKPPRPNDPDYEFYTPAEKNAQALQNQNMFLIAMTDSLARYAPYNTKVHALLNYADLAINTNTAAIQNVYYDYVPDIPDFNTRAARENELNQLSEEFEQAKNHLTSMGWDFSNSDDMEFLRTIFEFRRTGGQVGQDTFDAFMSKAATQRIYNVVDKDNMYKSLEDYFKETHLDNYQATEDIRNLISFIRNGNALVVSDTAEMNAQTTDLFGLINEIGETANKRGEINNMIGFSEGDNAFYNSFFVNDNDFKKADRIFDDIFKNLISEQKKVSVKASEMSQLDFVAGTFKIMKAGAEDPMDLKTAVRERLIKAEMWKDTEEEGLLPNERNARRAENEKNMTTLAKLYVLHEMQNTNTKIFYEPYWGDRQYTRQDAVADYLDINHPKIVKIKDLEANKVQHDQAILDHYGEEKGMLFEQNYNAYVMGALDAKQVIKLSDDKRTIRGLSYKDAKEELAAKGWNFAQNPADENYLIMLYNSYDTQSRNYHQIENCLDILLNKPVHNYYERNSVLRDMYQELREYKDDMTVDSLCDYLLEDIARTELEELRDKVKSAEPTPVYDVYKSVNGLTNMDFKNIMNQNGWEIDQRMDVLINRLYHSYDPQYPSAGAIAGCLDMLLNLPSDITVDQVTAVYSDMINMLEPYKRNDEMVENIEDYLFDLRQEAFAMKKAEAGVEPAAGIPTGVYYKKNFSKKKVTTEENNAIEDVNGVADNFMEEMKIEEFNLADPMEDFFRNESVPKEVVNDGINNQRENDQDIEFLIEEQKPLAVAFNKYKYLKQSFISELMESGGKLHETAKQKDREGKVLALGAEGTGTSLYRAMAGAIQNCNDVLTNPDSKPKDIIAALRALEEAASKYKEERSSMFGKRGDGLKRYQVSEKWSGTRISEMIISYKQVLGEIREAGKLVREDLKVNEITNRKAAFALGKAIGCYNEDNLPKMKRAELKDKFKAQDKLAKEQAKLVEKLYEMSGKKLSKDSFAEKSLNGMKKHDFAKNCVIRQYFDSAMRDGATLKDVKDIMKKIENKTFDKEVADLEKSKVFDRVIKNKSKNYYKVWNNVVRAGKDLSATSAEYLEGIKDMSELFDDQGKFVEFGSYIEYILPSDVAAESRDKTAYRKLAQVVSAQIVSANPEFAKGVAVDAIEKELTTHDIMNNLQKTVEGYLKKNKVLEGKNFSRDKLNRDLENGAFMKKVVVNIDKYVRENAARNAPAKDKTVENKTVKKNTANKAK